MSKLSYKKNAVKRKDSSFTDLSQTWTSRTSSNGRLKQHHEPQSTTRSIAHATSQLFSSKKWPVCLKTTTFSFETIAHEHKIMCVQNIDQNLRMRKRYSALSISGTWWTRTRGAGAYQRFFKLKLPPLSMRRQNASMLARATNLVPRVFLRTLEETKDSGKIRSRANSDWV